MQGGRLCVTIRGMTQRQVGYVELLRTNPDFTRLWVGQLVSNLGDWFNSVAVLALVYDLTGSGLATGLLIISSTLPAFILTPFAGAIVDRFDRRRIMLTADLTRGFLALGMLLVRNAGEIWMLYILSALLISFSSFFGPALSAAIPNLVKRDELISANGLSSSTWGLMLAVGAAIGGIVIALLGRDMAFVVNSISFFFSATMILLTRRPFGQPTAHLHPISVGSTLGDFRDSLSYMRTEPQVTASVLVKTGLGITLGIVLLLTVFAQSVFHAGDAGIGWFYSARGLGALIGPYLARPYVGHNLGKMRRAIAVAIFMGGVAYFAYSASPTFLLAALSVVVANVGTGICWTLSSTMLQLLVPDHLRGRVFALDFGLNTVVGAVSTFSVGVALEQWDPRMVASILAMMYIVFSIAWAGGIVISRARSPEHWAEVGRLAAGEE